MENTARIITMHAISAVINNFRGTTYLTFGVSAQYLISKCCQIIVLLIVRIEKKWNSHFMNNYA